MLNWSSDEDVLTLFDKCKADCNKDSFSVIVLSKELHDNNEWDIVATLYRNETERSQPFLNIMETDATFKKANVSIVHYTTTYIIDSLNNSMLVPKDIYIVSDLGDANQTIRNQISKSRVQKNKELQSLRTLLTKSFNIKTVNMDSDHPFNKLVQDTRYRNKIQKIKRDAHAKQFVSHIQ